MSLTKQFLIETREFDRFPEYEEEDQNGLYDPIVQQQVDRIVDGLTNLNKERFDGLMQGNSLFP